MPAIIQRYPDALDSTHLFCGLGGDAVGAERAGFEVRLALNHSPHAVRVHALNHPRAHHECANISLLDPRRFRRTFVLMASPSCTAHSVAAGSLRKREAQRELDLFSQGAAAASDPLSEAEVTRALMWDVPRWVEAQRPPYFIVENVLQALTKWAPAASWVAALRALGYELAVLSGNAFVAGSVQDRNRIFVVGWRAGVVPPVDLTLRPLAPCVRCGDVQAVQRWKARTVAYGAARGIPTCGKFGANYTFACPTCGATVMPYYSPLASVIDLSMEAPLIDSPRHGRPVAETVRLRLRKAFATDGVGPVMVTTNCTTHNGRVRPLHGLSFTMTGSPTQAIAYPDPAELATVLARAGHPEPLPVPAAARGAAGQPWARRYAGIDFPMEAVRYRMLTIRERATIQGFGPSFQLAGTPQQQHTGIGNAVDCNMAQWVFARVQEAMTSGTARVA